MLDPIEPDNREILFIGGEADGLYRTIDVNRDFIKATGRVNLNPTFSMTPWWDLPALRFSVYQIRRFRTEYVEVIVAAEESLSDAEVQIRLIKGYKPKQIR